MSAAVDAIPLASPMHWDPHESQLSFGSLGIPTNEYLPPLEPLFMGLDLSTQALKACFANHTLEVVAEYSVRFDEDLPEFGTKNGVHIADDGTVTSPVMMFLKAIDLLFERITASSQGKKLLSQTVAISGAAQQHATVYWSHQAETALGSLKPSTSLAEQLSSAFSLQTSPNWQDSSTTTECREMESLIGGEIELASRTGSRAHERFSGPQIMKVRKHQPDVYSRTSRISLVSSFLTTILCGDGRVHSMEESDACGTNLWNLRTGEGWDDDLLRIVAGGDKESQELRNKLGPVEVDGGVAAARVSSYLVSKYGLNRDAMVNHVTGDNNATLLSFSLLTGEVVASLGTSDTILLSTTDYAPSPESHVFSYPANRVGGKRSYMAMLCYKNGSLPREHVRNTYNSGSWNNFSHAVQQSGPPQSTREALSRPLGFYFLKPEIIPHNGYGVHRFDEDGNNVQEFKDPNFNSRAVLESQFLSFRTRVAPMMASATASSLPNRVYAVGGGSANTSMLTILSTVLGAPVYKPRASSVNSCAVGGCLKAYWCWARVSKAGGDALTFEGAIALARKSQMNEAELVAEPDQKASAYYGEMESRFRECEAKCIRASR